MSFTDLLGPTETTTENGTAQIARVEATSCAYRTGADDAAPSVSYQYGFAADTTFSDVDSFLEANKDDGDIEVKGVGESAVYYRHSDNNTAGIVVLLDGGKNFVIATNRAMPSQADFKRAATKVIERL